MLSSDDNQCSKDTDNNSDGREWQAEARNYTKAESWNSLPYVVLKATRSTEDVNSAWTSSIKRKKLKEVDVTWKTLFLHRRSYSSSAISQHSAVFDNSPSSCQSTPRVRRRSVKRIFGRLGSTGSVINSAPIADKVTTTLGKKRVKSFGTLDAVNFKLYMEALDQGLLTESDLEIWKIQEFFPSDDLRLYEGCFTKILPKPWSSQDVAEKLLSSHSSPPPTSRMSFIELRDKNIERHVSYKHSCQRINEMTKNSPKIIRRQRFTSVPHDMTHFRENYIAPYFQHAAFSKLPPSLQAKFKKMAQRRQSAPSIVIRGVLGRSNKLPGSLQNRDDSGGSVSPTDSSKPLSLKFGSHGAVLNLSKRHYVMEGKVQLTTGMQTQDRYMFLFTDLLLIAKAKSISSYKLKYRVRVCELWMASCIDEVCELTKSPDKSFVIGWPTTNCVATFSSSETKELWMNALLKHIADEKEKATPKTVAIKVINRDGQDSNDSRMINVSHTDTTKDVIRLSKKEFKIENNEEDYQLWVTSRKETSAYPLIGHEHPHAIQINHLRDSISSIGSVSEIDASAFPENEEVTQPEVRNRCQFVLRSSRQSPNKWLSEQNQRRMRIKPKTPVSFFNWARKRHLAYSNGHRNDNSDSGLSSASNYDSNPFSYSASSVSTQENPKLFSLPLSRICPDGSLPIPVKSMLDLLYRKAPNTEGIFRKSASARTTRLLKEKLNEDLDLVLSDAPIHVIAALFKDFLRNVPNSVLNSALYERWTEAIEQANDEDKMTLLRNLILCLDEVNQILVRRLFIVLNRIALKSDRNNMNSFNLSVCIAPSLLWPPSTAGPFTQTVSTLKVAEIVQFIVDRCSVAFDEIVVADKNWPDDMELKSEGEEVEDIDDDCEQLPAGESKSGDEKLQSVELYMDEKDDDDEKEDDDISSDVNHFNRSRNTRRQLQRRKPQSKSDAVRARSSSQDSLDQDLNDANTVMLDMSMRMDIESQKQLQPVDKQRGNDACSVSNDSGFTTLSGEDDDTLTYTTVGSKKGNGIAVLDSVGTSPTGLSCLSSPTELDENIQISANELKSLWSPSLLHTVNGKIVEEDVRLIRCNIQDVAEEENNSREEENQIESVNESSRYRRRKSEPAYKHKATRAKSSGPESRRGKEVLESSRLVKALASPTVEFKPGTEITFQYNPLESHKQKPTYIIRLNDTSQTGSSHSTTEYHKQKKDTSLGMAKEYLNQLRGQSTEEVVLGITGNIEVAQDITDFTDKQNHDNDLNNNEKNDDQKENVKRPRSLSLPLKTLDMKTDSDDVEHIITSENDVTASSDNVSPTSNRSPTKIATKSQHPVSYRTDIEIKPSLCYERGQERNVNFLSKVQSNNFSQSVGLNPIQKLTENLNLIPNFRVQMTTHAIHDDTESTDPFSERRKASSVRVSRSNHPLQNRSLNTHVVKVKTPKATDDSQKDTKNESASRQRRRRSRPPVACTPSRLNTTMSRADGESLFSNSLPSGKLRQVLNTSPRKESENIANRPQISVKFTDTSNNDNIRSFILNRPDVHASTERGVNLQGSREREPVISSGNVKDSKGRQQTSVKSKISAYNDMICKQRSASEGFSSTSSTNDVQCLPQVDSPSKEPSSKGVDAKYVHLDAMLADFESKAYPSLNGNKSQTNERNSESVGKCNGVTLPENITRLKSGKIYLNVATVAPGEVRLQHGNRPVRENYLSPVLSPDIPSSPLVRRPSPQALSDEILFNLSESFAFGNRKSPRSLTPCSGNTPHDSPVSFRKRSTETTTFKAPSSPGQYTSQERRQTSPGSGDMVQSSDINRNISAFKKQHKKPSKSIHESSCNSPVLSFGGFQKVIHSEESYV